MDFSKLRLSSFKSFVEPIEIEIKDGLTGVVGPNGCGKSNLVEAIRWVMGEASYKSMRASSMEGVIFQGTQNRPSRNSAEVSLVLNNKDRDAPLICNDTDLIEVTRKANTIYEVKGQWDCQDNKNCNLKLSWIVKRKDKIGYFWNKNSIW